MNDTVENSLTTFLNTLVTRFYTNCLGSHWPCLRKLIDFPRILPRVHVWPSPSLNMHEQGPGDAKATMDHMQKNDSE